MPVLMDVGRAISLLPKDHTWHRQIKRVYEQRRAMMESGEGIDWAMAEALAFGTLVNEGMLLCYDYIGLHSPISQSLEPLIYI